MRIHTLAAALGAVALVTVPVSATVVSGQVTNTSGGGIENVDLDFIDRNTGASIPLTNDKTDILGFYSVTVPAGDYDVQFEPPQSARFVAHEERGVRVQGGSMTLDQTLEPGWFVSGRTVDNLGTPLGNIDLDFIDVVDGELFVAHDNTAANGTFQVAVPKATYDIRFRPPIGSDSVPKELVEVGVTGDTPLGDVVLPNGFHLTGTVVDPFAQPAATVQVRTLDPATGEEIFNIRRNTDSLGAYDLVVEPGGYDLLLVPARGDSTLPRFVSGVVVDGATALPTIELDGGVVASGKVIDSNSNEVQGVDLDFVDTLSDVERLTPRDNVDDKGEYDIAVPGGTYDIRFDPFAGSGLASAILRDFALATDTSMPTVVLADGQALTGNVEDGVGTALVDVDLDVFDAVTDEEIPLTSDNTDVSGAFEVLVPAGTYDVVFTPPTGSGNAQERRDNVVVAGGVDLGTIVLSTASTAAPSGIAPNSGPASGGTFVTITGTVFEPGVEVFVGGVPLVGATRIGSAAIEGTTPAHRPGAVDVRVLNPGASDAVLVAAFTYTAPAVDPVLTLDRVGPLGTDVLLQWTNTGQGSYTVFRSTSASAFANASTPIDRTTGTSFRDDGVASPTAPDNLLFWVIQ